MVTMTCVYTIEAVVILIELTSSRVLYRPVSGACVHHSLWQGIPLDKVGDGFSEAYVIG